MIFYIAKERDTDRQAGSKAPNDIYTLCEREKQNTSMADMEKHEGGSLLG